MARPNEPTAPKILPLERLKPFNKPIYKEFLGTGPGPANSGVAKSVFPVNYYQKSFSANRYFFSGSEVSFS